MPISNTYLSLSPNDPPVQISAWNGTALSEVISECCSDMGTVSISTWATAAAPAGRYRVTIPYCTDRQVCDGFEPPGLPVATLCASSHTETVEVDFDVDGSGLTLSVVLDPAG